MPQWPPFPQGSAGTTARLLPTLCPAWSVPAFPEGITAALWSVFSIRIVSCLFFGEVRGYFKLQNKSVLYRCPLSVCHGTPRSPMALKSGSSSGEVVCFTKWLTHLLSRWCVSVQMCLHPAVLWPGPSPSSLAAPHPHAELRRSM